MRLQKFSIEGFRSLKSVDWHPGSLNVIIGPNSSGKSNLLSALDMLAASAQGKLHDYVLESGGMDSLVWDGCVHRIKPRIETSGLTTRDAWSYRFEMRRGSGSTATGVEEELLWDISESDRRELPLLSWEREEDYGFISDGAEVELQFAPNEFGKNETVLSQVSGPLTKNRDIREFQRRLAQWSVHLALDTERGAPIRQASVASHQTALTRNGDNLVSVLHTLYTGNRCFKQAMDEAMRAALGPDYEELLFPPASEQRIQLAIRWKSLSRVRSAVDMADGVLRFVYLVTLLANPEPPGLVAIDEPETGLHPSMLPIVAEYAASAASKAQIVMTTHSPEFLDAFRDETPTVTVVTCPEGQTLLRSLDANELNEWLRLYSLGELHRAGATEAIG